MATFTIQYLTNGNGIITGESSQTVESGESGTQVVASPDTEYAFVQWSDGEMSPVRQEDNVTENLVITAYFRKARNLYKTVMRMMESTP